MISTEQKQEELKSLTVITPVFNDWDCLPSLIGGLGRIQESLAHIHLLIINDGSTQNPSINALDFPEWITSIKVVHVGCNVGHQRAIAIGISEVVRHSYSSLVMVIDSDGEDIPEDVHYLLSAIRKKPEAIVVAKRKGRTENQKFKASYRCFKLLFELLTGKRLDFGNFSIFTYNNAVRLAYMPELWNHFPATVLKSRLLIYKVPLDRGKRFMGSSKMSFAPLISHGLAAISVMLEIVFSRILVIASILILTLFCLGLVILAVRFNTGLAIPGWATTTLGFTLISLLQIMALVALITFQTLSSRSRFSRPTVKVASEYILNIQSIRESA